MSTIKLLSKLLSDSNFNIKQTTPLSLAKDGDILVIDGKLNISKTMSGRSILTPVDNEIPAYIHTQGIAQITWTVVHNAGCTSF